MNQHDPTLHAISTTNLGDREITVDEMQQIINAQNVSALHQEPTMSVSDITGIETGNLSTGGGANVTTGSGGAGIGTQAGALPGPIPIPIPFPIPKRAVSGRYRSPAAFFQVELRVDVDGKRPCNQVSGDFYQVSGGTTTYFGSFVVKTPTLTVTATTVTCRGLGQFTFGAGAPVVQVTIPRVSIFSPAPHATLQFFTTGGAPGASYSCAYESQYFRTVVYERDRITDVTTPEFTSYNTASFPSGGPNRTLNVQSAYAEAGVEVQVLPEPAAINIGEAGANHQWSDSELNASMALHFNQFRNVPQWDVYEMVCQLHELGPGLYGIMFDYQDAHQRQGCAVFHAGIGGTTNDKLRLQLYTYVHEMGHCFNLMHSWQKNLANPPGTNRPASLSWMNYPWNYPLGGEPAFWNAFPFQFDDGEIQHIRHAFRNNVIMGADPFGTNAGLMNPQAFSNPLSDLSGLQFEISTPRSVLLGEPVVLRLNLKTTDGRGKVVHSHLHPSAGLVNVAIQNPSGQVRVFEPIMEHCVGAQYARIDANTPGLEDSAYIGYGKGGLTFDQGGMYKIRATYCANDGSQVVSNIINLRVRNPITSADESVADLLMGEQQGVLFALMGSDSQFLETGNKAFDEVLAKHGSHPLANYVRLVKGVNLGRDFKLVVPGETKLQIRRANHQQRIEMLGTVEKNATTIGLDSTTTDQVRTYLAESQRKSGDLAGAAETEKRIARKAVRTAGAR